MNLQLNNALSSAQQNYDHAFAHVQALTQSDPNECIINVRMLHDQRKDIPAIPRIGKLPDLWNEICHYNKQEYGVFINITELDGLGYHNSNVISCRVQAVDLDNVDAEQKLQEANNSQPAPSFAVQSSPGKYHLYYITPKHNNFEKYSLIQRKLAQLYNGDKSISDPARVLRMAGTYHCKGAPFLTNCFALSGYGYITPVETLEYHTQHINLMEYGGSRKELGDQELQAPSLAWVQTALRMADPNQMTREEWISFTAAIKQAGWNHVENEQALFAIWSDWCAQYEHNDLQENSKQWQSIRDTQLGWKSLTRRIPELQAHWQHAQRMAQQGAQGQQDGQGVVMPHQVGQTVPSAPAIRSCREILAAVSQLTEGDIEEIQTICSECSFLNPIEQDQVLRALKTTTKMNLGALRQMIALNKPETQEPDHNEIAQDVIEDIGRDNIIMSAADVWKWNESGVWSKQEDRAIKQSVQRKMSSCGLMISKQRVDGVSDVLKNDIYKDHHKFNLGNPETVNCENGELQLVDGAWFLIPHNKLNYRTTQIPVLYNSAAHCPNFLNFLNEVFAPDIDRHDKIKVILEMIGYTLMSHASQEKFIMLIGAGANGKSVLLTIIEELCGKSNIAAVQPSAFDNIFQRAYLDQKLANIIAELKQGETIADGELKVITSGDASTVENKQGHPFTMHSFATCWFGTNHMPHTRDFSDALFRRAIIVRFNRVFQPHEQDVRMKAGSFWTDELPGILNLALNAYARVLVNGWTVPQSSEAAKQEWRLEADQVAAFVDDRCLPVAGQSMAIGSLYEVYQKWASDNGIKQQVSQKGFRDRLTHQGFGQHRSNTARLVTGIILKPQIF